MGNLEQFVLDYLQEAGSLVEPPAYRVYEVLLPETLAERWQISPYLELSFNETEREDVLRLGYNHPLVEQMVQEAHGRPASTSLYINDLRLDKTGLDELAMKSWVVLNGRTQPQKRATVARVRHTYVRFNFKAALLSDEKQERLVSVLIDAHTGCRVPEADEIEAQATAVAPDALLESLPDAPIRWQPKGHPAPKSPLDAAHLIALLEQAQTAVQHEMADALTALQKRVNRFLQLDEARLTDYYDDLEKDLRTRLQTASEERRPGLQDKLTAVQTERQHKLDDLAERYQVRINLTLLNVLIIQQPKLIQGVQIANRSSETSAYAVWDPLLRQLDPLHCQVCGQPGQRIYLCQNGHLAHEECLAPACIDCKRVFCHDCAHEVGACDVCHKPLCRYSQIRCPECGRHTCQEHRGLCHADNGRPVDLSVPTAPPPPTPAPPPPPQQPPPTASSKSRGKTTSATTAKPKAPPKAAPIPKGPQPIFMDVLLEDHTVTGFMVGKREKLIARRVWTLDPDEGGILRNCDCEKGKACAATGMIIRPSDQTPLEKQLLQEINNFAKEYKLSSTKINHYRISSLNGEWFPVPRVELSGLWKNEEALAHARQTFEHRYWKR